MATERIVSPGVSTKENDSSFLAQSVQQLGAVVVGPTQKGPAFIPTRIIGTYNDFINKFGGFSNDTYVPFTVNAYLANVSTITVVRVLGNGGWGFAAGSGLVAIAVSGSGPETSGHGNELLAVLHPSKNTSTLTLHLSTLNGQVTSSITGSFTLVLSGSGFGSATTVVSASVIKTSPFFLEKTLGVQGSADNSKTGSVFKATAFPYILFKDTAAGSFLTGSKIIAVTSSTAFQFTQSLSGISYKEGYVAAETPWIKDGNTVAPQKLFKFVHLSHGFFTNDDIYVSVNGLQEPADINGVPQYSTFGITVRKIGDTDKQPSIVEQYNNLNLNPASPNFIARVIGDRYFEYDTTLNKVVQRGNYANVSAFVRVLMGDSFDANLTVSALSVKVSPRGFEVPYQTIIGFTGFNMPTASYRVVQALDGFYDTRAYLGFDFSVQDNINNYLNPVPTVGGVGTFANQSDFTVNSLSGHPSSSYVGSLSASVDVSGVSGPTSNQVKFSIPFQGGSDGLNYSTIKNVGSDISATNVFGYDLSSIGAIGAVGYNKAITILANADEYDFNLLAVPGVLHELHPSVTINAIQTVDSRGDAFYVLDGVGLNSTVGNAVNQVATLDTSYAGTYYPWVKILDSNNNRPVFVPPSVVVPGVFAYNDKQGQEWFAPAGFNRGGLPGVIEPKNRLSAAERDVLYTGRVNPIAIFPGQGTVIWGQKTLQAKASALDRINVRRLLIALKKFIATYARNLVFEQNTTVTRNKFLGVVNPYLESVQQKQGLYAYRVVMDDSNNSPSQIDQNLLTGDIYIQPSKTAEFIVLNFNISNSSATFS